VPPIDAATKQAMLNVVNTLRSDKLSGWFWYAVSCIDPLDDPNDPKKPSIVPGKGKKGRKLSCSNVLTTHQNTGLLLCFRWLSTL
jgi:hypothetical protein